MGRPATGTGDVFSVRLPKDLIARFDAWRGPISRPEAVRQLIESALNRPASPLVPRTISGKPKR
jgi:hypothetical protein